MTEIAHIENDYTSKFGVPRQSGLTNAMPSRIIFSSQYRNPDALRGIDLCHLGALGIQALRVSVPSTLVAMFPAPA